MAFCSKCGKELKKDANFCDACGTEIIKNNKVSDKEKSKVPEESEKTINKFKNLWNNMEKFSRLELVVSFVVVILILIAFATASIFPIIISFLQIVGLIFAWFVHKGKIKNNNKWLKYVILIVVILVSIVNIGSYSWDDKYDDLTIYSTVKVDTPYESEECKGKNYLDIKNQFSSAGFTNVNEEMIDDLDKDTIDKNGVVEEVIINGKNKFKLNQEFKSTANVVIKYHTLKRIKLPTSSIQSEFTDIEALMSKFSNAGFLNIDVEEKFDIDPDTTEREFLNEVTINGNSVFTENDMYPLDAEIKIVTHRPYEKYTAKIIIDFVPNIIFDKYNVEFEFNGETNVIEHGKDAEFEYRVEPGKYKGTFTSVSSSDIKGVFELEVIGDTNAEYTICCYSTYISVKNDYIEQKGKIGENEAMMPNSSYDFKYDNYKDVEQKLKDAGFTNVSTEILYDIFWGWTEEGEVEKVSIDGKESFNRGNIFKKDSKIVITYHMKEEDDPNRKVEETNTVEIEQPKEEKKEENVVETQNTTVEIPKEETKVEDVKEEKYNFYTTNDNTIAKKGNTGKYAYYEKGKFYDIYWVIDFDEGYVYYFTDGMDENWCDKYKIKSGNLNDGLKLSYTDKNYEWVKSLHFKYWEQPHQLVILDVDNIEWEYETVSLKNALDLIATKDVKIR